MRGVGERCGKEFCASLLLFSSPIRGYANLAACDKSLVSATWLVSLCNLALLVFGGKSIMLIGTSVAGGIPSLLNPNDELFWSASAVFLSLSFSTLHLQSNFVSSLDFHLVNDLSINLSGF